VPVVVPGARVLIRRSRWQQLGTAIRPYILRRPGATVATTVAPSAFCAIARFSPRRANVRGVDPVHVVDADTDDVVDDVVDDDDVDDVDTAGVTGGRSQTAGRRRKAFTRPRIRHHAYICR